MNERKRNDDVKASIRKLEAIIEIAALAILFFLVWRGFYRVEGHLFNGRGKYVLLGVYALLIIILFYYSEGFKFGYLRLTDVVISQWVALVIVNFITYFQLSLMINKMINPFPLVGMTFLGMAICLIMSYIFSVIYHRLYVPRNMVLIYGDIKAVSIKLKLDTRSDKYRITRMVSTDEGLEAICRIIDQHDAVVINDVHAEMRNDIMKYCYKTCTRAYIVPKISDIINRGAKDINLFDTPLLLVKGTGLTRAQAAGKRAFDLIFSIIALAPGLPIMLIVAIAIKLDDHGPVFYRQKRVTKDGQVFDILKFRSMVVDAEKDGKSRPATQNDPRITRVGKVIRASRLDELPQVLNIFKGDMSWCGPRPERCEHVEKYTKLIPEFVYRSKVKGGLTGYAQIYGKYNTSAYDKLRLDLMYIENYSILTDLKLLLMTIKIMFKKESTEGFDKVIDEHVLQELVEKNKRKEQDA
ncbi:MAG: sugar transferase [Eubacterium sp.]|nr:sugar transferase [Eubacterium sp.]